MRKSRDRCQDGVRHSSGSDRQSLPSKAASKTTAVGQKLRSLASAQYTLWKCQVEADCFLILQHTKRVKQIRDAAHQYTNSSAVQKLFSATVQLSGADAVRCSACPGVAASSPGSVLGPEFGAADIQHLCDAAAYATAAYEVTDRMAPPLYLAHLSPKNQETLYSLLAEDPEGSCLVDLQFSRAPNTASFFILSRVERNEIILSFRGTQEFGDLLTDLMCTKGEGSRAEFHSGALESVTRDYGRIEQSLLGLAAAMPHSRIIIAGHSLGGGLAVTFGILFFTALKEKNPALLDRVEVITFGAMTSVTTRGMKNFEEFHSKVINVMSPRDPVPNVALPILAKIAENTPGTKNFLQDISFTVSTDGTDREGRGVPSGSESERKRSMVWHWSPTMERRVIFMAFFDDPGKDYSEESKKKIVTNVLNSLREGGVVQNESIPILHQFGRSVALLRNEVRTVVAEVPSFHEVIYAHMALARYVEDPGKAEDEEQVEPESPPTALERFKRNFRRNHKMAEHHMKTIPELLKSNLDYHSIVMYQSSLEMANMYDDVLRAAEKVMKK